VSLDSELAKWQSHGYEHSSKGKGHVTLSKTKGKITHSVTIHHEGGEVTKIEPKQSGSIGALPPEQRRDYKEADVVRKAAIRSVKRPKGTPVH
jgi:hypothetical protein